MLRTRYVTLHSLFKLNVDIRNFCMQPRTTLRNRHELEQRLVFEICPSEHVTWKFGLRFPEV